MRATWHNPRPRLAIELVRSWIPRNCVQMSVYRVTSTPFRLTPEQFTKLDAAGFLGSGQSHRLLSQCDGKEAPAFFDSVTCKDFDAAGNLVRDPSLNDKGEPAFPPHDIEVFVYEVERLCDSGD